MSLGNKHIKKLNPSRLIIYILAVGLCIFLLWASNFQIERGIRAQGQIIATDRTQVVQSPDPGVIYQIHVKEGDRVTKGQILVELEKERADAAFIQTKAKVAALKITLIRLQAEVFGTPLVFPKELQQYSAFISNQTVLYKKRKQAIDDDIESLSESLKLAQEELEMNMPIYKTGDVAKADILRLQRQITDIKGQISGKRNKYFQDAQTDMTKVQEELATQEQDMLDRQQLLEHTTLIAPMDGIVKKMIVTTIGGVVKQGDEVLELLPTESSLLVEAKIQPIDMSNMVVGLPALIKLDAYDYSIYGAMIGKVDYISPDSLTEQTKNGELIYYKAKIRIEAKEFHNKLSKNIIINPGMTVTVDIKTGQRTVLEYMTKPLTKTLQESLKEK